MKIVNARNICREWVLRNAPGIPHVTGAFFHGSVNWVGAEHEMASTSDVDIMLVSHKNLAPMPKFSYRNLLIDVSFVHEQDISSPELILEKYFLAGDFRNDNTILDPGGRLRHLQGEVEKEFYKKHRVVRRAELALIKAKEILATMPRASALPDRFTAWLFSRGVLTHVLLNAGLRNPTVRRRYQDTRVLLEENDGMSLYEDLLALSRFRDITRDQAMEHLRDLSFVFDMAAGVIKSPYQFAGDITSYSKKIAVSGSEELIEAGFHREAMFWICASFSRCMHVINQDAETPEQIAMAQERFDKLLNTLGLPDPASFNEGDEQFNHMVPIVWEAAMMIIGSN